MINPFQNNNIHQMHCLTIRVPIDTEWNPILVGQFMTTLFAIPGQMKLTIMATQSRLDWQISAEQRLLPAIHNAIYSFCPLANISQNTVVMQPNTNDHVLYYEMAEPFVRPIKYAADFVHLDPLTTLINALSNIEGSMRVIYELALMPVNEEHLKLGNQLLTRPRSGLLDYITPQGAFNAVVDKSMGLNRVQRYYPELQKLARHKLAMLLKMCMLSIQG